jgi:hypothetical protein
MVKISQATGWLRTPVREGMAEEILFTGWMATISVGGG